MKQNNFSQLAVRSAGAGISRKFRVFVNGARDFSTSCCPLQIGETNQMLPNSHQVIYWEL